MKNSSEGRGIAAPKADAESVEPSTRSNMSSPGDEFAFSVSSSTPSMTDGMSAISSPYTPSDASPNASIMSSPIFRISPDPTTDSNETPTDVTTPHKTRAKGTPTNAPLTIRSFSSGYGTAIAAAFGAAVDFPKVKLKTPKAENPPPSVRFKPNVTVVNTNPSSKLRSAATRQSSLVTIGTTGVSGILAQSLRMNNQSEAIRNESAPLNRGFTGPLGARRNRQPTSSNPEQQIKIGFNLSKTKKSDASKNLTEICWADTRAEGMSLYLPLSLPYILKDYDDLGAAASTSRRPTVQRVDEANRNAAAIFQPSDENKDEAGHDWYIIQFPIVLPAVSTAAMERQRAALSGDQVVEIPSKRSGRTNRVNKNSVVEAGDDAAARDAPGSVLRHLPEGRLGTLKLHASGRTKLWIANHAYNVNQGSECSFAQDVSCYVDSNSEFMFLGKCGKRITVVPDIDKMIDITKPEFMKAHQ